MGPAVSAGIGNAKSADLAVGFGRGLDQRHDAIVEAEIEMAVRVCDRRRPGARTAFLFPPFDLAGLYFGAKRKATIVVIAIHVIANHDQASMLVLQFVVVIEWCRLDFAIGSAE